MVTIDKRSSKPYYEQLVLAVKEEVLQGVLNAGDRLPSVREMAKILLMNPNTVSKAYKVLESEQVLVTIKVKGTFVNKVSDQPRDEFKIRQVKENFAELIVEAIHLQVTEKEMTSWIRDSYETLGGMVQ